MIWESIPKTICENIIEHMKQRWELCIKYNGRRIDRELLKKIPKVGHDFKFRLKKKSINGIRISYNDKFIVKLKNKDIKEKTNNLILLYSIITCKILLFSFLLFINKKNNLFIKYLILYH